MTYNQGGENAIEEPQQELPLPAWIKTLRALVYVLMGVSILAMCALIYAALSIVNKETSLLDVSLPENAELISVTQMADGRMIVIYDQDGIKIELRGDDGALISEATIP